MNRSYLFRAYFFTFIFLTVEIANAAPPVTGPYASFADATSLSVATPPVTVTIGASNITTTSAQLNGTSNPNNLVTQAWFDWGTTPAVPLQTSQVNVGFGAVPVTFNRMITGLTPSTTYFFQATSSNFDGTTNGSILSFATAPFTRDSAIAVVTRQVINSSPYKNSLIAFLYDPPGADSTLQPGSAVESFGGDFASTLPDERWFFWIDLTGDVKFAHPTHFVLINPMNAAVELYDAEWWPVVTPAGDTARQVWQSIDDRFTDAASIVYGSYVGDEDPPAIGPLLEHGTKFIDRGIQSYPGTSRKLLSGKTCGILVGGAALKNGEGNAWQNDIDSVRTALTTPAPGGGPGSGIANGGTQEKNNATKADIEAMLAAAAADNCNSIIFYYTGHGGNTGGGYMVISDGAGGTEELSYADLATMLNIAGLKFKNVFLDDCYAGLAEDDFGGKTVPVTIIMSADSTHTSAVRIRYLSRDTIPGMSAGDSITGGRSKYTSEWMKCWRKLRISLNRNPTLKEIHDWLRQGNPDSINQKQNPQVKVIIPPISITLPINGPGTYPFLGTGVLIDFPTIANPFMLTVTLYFDPPPGDIDPIEPEILGLSLRSHWSIVQDNPVPFMANIHFEFDTTVETIPIDFLRLARRPEPTFSNPDPLWQQYQPSFLTPGPAGYILHANNVNSFSQWAFGYTAGQVVSVDLPLEAKWNMVSVPVQLEDYAKTTLFPNAVSNAFRFASGYVADDSLDIGTGYWVKVPSAETITMTGPGIVRDTIPLTTGWNLVGSVGEAMSLAGVSTIPSGVDLSNFFGYSSGYYVTDSIRSGRGYWVKAGGDCQLVLNSTNGAAAPKLPPLNTFHSITIRDASGVVQTLYIAEETDVTRSLNAEMPPLPPAGVLDARFASGQWMETYSASASKRTEYPMQLTSAQYPLRVEWSMKSDERASISLNGSQALRGTGSMTIEREGPLVLSVGRMEVPKVFALHQNYPNPFNPLTVIRYELPVSSYLSLKVYNVLGAEVATLIDGETQEAGEHQATFDASRLASGVYYYKLVAGTGFTQVRKMVLVK